MPWQVGNTIISSRLLLGTARYPSPAILQSSIQSSGTEIITVSLRREMAGVHTNPNKAKHHGFWSYIQNSGCHLLPNTAGCRSAKEAITTALMAREMFETHWIKLEVIGDEYTLQPNPFELVDAAHTLVQEGFLVFPYCTDDLILCQELVNVGCNILMPWAAPIGSGQGPLNPLALKTLRQRFPNQILIVDAGIGAPSHGTQLMEMGYDAILVNSAVALATDPVKMASAFKHAIQAGYLGHQAGIMPKRDFATPSTPTIGQPFWQQHSEQVSDD